MTLTVEELIALLVREDPDKPVEILGSFQGKAAHADGSAISRNACIGLQSFDSFVGILREI